MLNTILAKFFKVSDYRRWDNPKFLSKSWDQRTIKIAKLIPPNTSVLELGAGRMVLKEYLHPSCTYTPSDFVARGSGVLVINLNSKPYKFLNDCGGKFDVAVFSGVLEYIHDLESLMSYLYNYIDKVVLSYAGAVKGENTSDRRSKGWVNDFTYEELIVIFRKAGFDVEKVDTWKQQDIFVLSKKYDLP